MSPGLSVMMMILVNFLNDIWTLPSPTDVVLDSVNMRHILRWRPPLAKCNTTLLYSVQYQGDFERLLRNGSWVDAFLCRSLALARCDLSDDLASDSDYSIQVRAECGSQRSDWTRLSSPFNRRNTRLTPPEVTVKTAGDALQVGLEKVPLWASASVTVWRKDELQRSEYRVEAEQRVLTVPALQEGTLYCVQAQIVLHSGRHSNKTRPLCVSFTGPDAAPWRTPVSVVCALLLVLGLLFAVSWSVVHCRPGFLSNFFRKEPLPAALRQSWIVPDQTLLDVEEPYEKNLEVQCPDCQRGV